MKNMILTIRRVRKHFEPLPGFGSSMRYRLDAVALPLRSKPSQTYQGFDICDLGQNPALANGKYLADN